MNTRTIEESMAIAVLQGDRAAARALADRLVENYSVDGTKDNTALTRQEGQIALGNYAVYSSDEFKALCKLLNIAWGLDTITMTIHFPADGRIQVTQRYATRINES